MEKRNRVRQKIGRVAKVGHGMAKIVFPPRCPVCDEVLPMGRKICGVCEGKLVPIRGSRCMKCGKPMGNQISEYCYDCQKTDHVFDAGRAVYLYNLPMQRAMYRFKYLNRREYGEFFADRIVEELGEWILRQKVDAIVPIPLHITRKRSRGYNQAEIIARAVGANLGIPVDEKILERCRKTEVQKVLNDVQRKNNLKKAFKISKNELQLEKVMLIDDIYTTGSTMDAAAEALKSGGVNWVGSISVSIGSGY